MFKQIARLLITGLWFNLLPESPPQVSAGKKVWIFPISEGKMQFTDGKVWYHVFPDPSMTPVYKQKYDWTGPFSQGLAAVKKDGQFFHIFEDGKPAYSQKYDWVGPFSQGLAVATLEGTWFHIRIDGTPAYKQRYSFVSSFSHGRAEAWERGKEEFYIRLDGTRIN